MSCWCERLSIEERAAAELVTERLGGTVTDVQVGKRPEVLGAPCRRHDGLGNCDACRSGHGRCGCIDACGRPGCNGV